MNNQTCVKTKWYDSLIWKIQNLSYSYKNWCTKRMLQKIVKWSDSGYIKHAKAELPGFKKDPDEMDALMASQLVELLAVFSHHGHSGFSAPYALNMFKELAMFKPLGPLTGEDEEWSNVSDYAFGVKEQLFQNKRCSHVFKEVRNDGTVYCYDSQGKIFKDKNGLHYTCKDSSVEVTFPYTPKSEYVDEDPSLGE